MSLLVTWKNLEKNWVFKLINKILLFYYSEGIFSAHDRAIFLTLVHDTRLIKLSLASYKLSGSSPFSQKNEHMNNETMKIG